MDTTLVLRIRLDDDGRSPTGTLDRRGTSTSFSGWLGLFAALDGLLVGSEPDHRPPEPKGDPMATIAPSAGHTLHRPADTGPAYWGPGDRYTFLVTGEESGGAYFAMEAFVPPGGGPGPHIHTREDETFYLLEGEIEFLLGDETVLAGPGDFVNVPRGVPHRFRNAGTETARLVVTFTPAGMEGFFEETLDSAPSGSEDVPDNAEDVGARYVAAATRYGLEFV